MGILPLRFKTILILFSWRSYGENDFQPYHPGLHHRHFFGLFREKTEGGGGQGQSRFFPGIL
jgi:hypothetical protein